MNKNSGCTVFILPDTLWTCDHPSQAQQLKRLLQDKFSLPLSVPTCDIRTPLMISGHPDYKVLPFSDRNISTSIKTTRMPAAAPGNPGHLDRGKR